MKKLIFLFFLFTTICFAQTSEWYNTFYTDAGAAITTGTFEVVPYLNTYPAGAIKMTHLKGASWKVLAPVGTYKLYYNGVAVPSYSKIFVGEEILAQIAHNFTSDHKLPYSGLTLDAQEMISSGGKVTNRPDYATTTLNGDSTISSKYSIYSFYKSDLLPNVPTVTAAENEAAVDSFYSIYGKNATLSMSPGTYNFTPGYTINANVYLEDGAVINDSVVFKGVVDGTLSKHFATAVNLDSASINICYPEYWDAVGDGVTNDSLAIHKSIVSSTNKILNFTNGTYYFGTQNVTNKVSINVEGNAILKQATIADSGGYFFKFTANGSSLRGNGVIDLNKSAFTSVTGYMNGILIQADSCEVEGITIKNLPNKGITIYEGNANKISNVKIKDGIYYGIYLDKNSSGNTIESCNISADFSARATMLFAGTSAYYTGIYTNGDTGTPNEATNKNNKIINNTIRMISYSQLQRLSSSSADSAKTVKEHGIEVRLSPNTIITGNHIFGGEMSISAGIGSNHSTISYNDCLYAYECGIELPDVAYTSVSTNTIVGDSTGLVLRGVSDDGAPIALYTQFNGDNVLTGNTIKRAKYAIYNYQQDGLLATGNIIDSLLNSSGGIGIYCRSSDNLNLSINTINLDGGYSGMRIQDVNRFNVIGNIVSGTNVTGIGIHIYNSSDTCSNGRIIGNNIASTIGNAFPIPASYNTNILFAGNYPNTADVYKNNGSLAQIDSIAIAGILRAALISTTGNFSITKSQPEIDLFNSLAGGQTTYLQNIYTAGRSVFRIYQGGYIASFSTEGLSVGSGSTLITPPTGGIFTEGGLAGNGTLRETVTFSGTDTVVTKVLSGSAITDYYVVSPVYSSASVPYNANDNLRVVPTASGVTIRRSPGGTSDLEVMIIKVK